MEARDTRRPWLWPTVAGLAAAALACFQIHDPDVPWQVATGRWILDHGSLPTVDPFSFTHGGAPWANHSPTFQIVLALSYAAGGFVGVSLLKMLVVAVIAAVSSVVSRTRGADPRAAVILATLAVAGSVSALSARPRLLAYLCMASSWALLLLPDRRPDDRRTPWLLVPLYALWLGGHASHLLLPALGAFVLIGHVLRGDRERTRALLLPVASVVMLFAAFGRSALDLVMVHGGSGWAAASISEWRGLDLLEELEAPGGWCRLSVSGLALLGAAVVLSRWLVRRVRGRAPEPAVQLDASAIIEALAILAFGLGALAGSQRLLALFSIGFMPLWLPVAASLVSPLFRPRPRLAAGLGGAAVALLLTFYGGGRPTLRPGVGLDAHRFPVAALSTLAASGDLDRVYNAYNFGGYLLHEGHEVFIDGRALTVYPEAFLSDFTRAYGDPELFEELAARYGVESVLLPVESFRAASLVAYLEGSDRWRRTYRDSVAVAFARLPQ